MLPSFFIAHGSPMLAVEDNAYTRLLNRLGASITPRAILLFSAHWESPTQLISSAAQYRTIHDFGGFPGELYQITYPARGDAAVAAEVLRLLEAEGIPGRLDPERGLDHGAWVVLRLLRPRAEIPVVALSVDPSLPPSELYRTGKALAPLRGERILIIASGGTVHNFSTMRWRTPDAEPDPWAVAFDDWLTERMSSWDLAALYGYERLAPHANLAVPPGGKEHFIPLFYAMGAAGDQRTCRELHRSYQFGNLSHAVWQFGAGTPPGLTQEMVPLNP